MDIAYLKEHYKVESTLNSVGLLHLSRHFSKKGVTADVFLNLERDDLEYLGVNVVEEQDKILSEIQPFSKLYTNLACQNFNVTTMLRIGAKHMKWVESVLSHLYANAKARRQVNGMIDDSHSTGSAIITLCDAMLNQVQYIQNASTKIESKRKNYMLVILGSSVVVPLLVLVTLRPQTPLNYVQTAFSRASSFFKH